MANTGDFESLIILMPNAPKQTTPAIKEEKIQLFQNWKMLDKGMLRSQQGLG